VDQGQREADLNRGKTWGSPLSLAPRTIIGKNAVMTTSLSNAAGIE
jgi:hypothetical protein